MSGAPARNTVDLSEYPDLVVIYLGMRVEAPRGLETLKAPRPQIEASVAEKPDGLLLNQRLIYSEDAPLVSTRQYWRDSELLLAWILTLPVGMALFASMQHATGSMLSRPGLEPTPTLWTPVGPRDETLRFQLGAVRRGTRRRRATHRVLRRGAGRSRRRRRVREGLWPCRPRARDPQHPGTQFATASATKGLTALAVVGLIEDGALTLTTTARSVLGSDLPLIDDGGHRRASARPPVGDRRLPRRVRRPRGHRLR